MKLVITLVTLLLIINTTFAGEAEILADAFALYKRGSYQSSLDLLVPLKVSKKKRATVSYLKGLIYSNLEEYDTASREFEKAITYKTTSRDIYYRLGQAYYAQGKNSLARKMFTDSYLKYRYEVNASMYYVAYILQSSNKHKEAIKIYKKIKKSKRGLTINFKQMAMFQIAEINLDRFSDSKKTKIFKKIRKLYLKALAVAPKSAQAFEIQSRIDLVNERISGSGDAKKWSLNFLQEFTYDSNVTYEASGSTVKSTEKSSSFSKTNVLGNYAFNIGKRFTLTPELMGDFARYTNRENREVYQNDSYSITSSVKTATAHRIAKKKARVLFDIGHSYSARDHQQENNVTKYGTNYSILLGDKISFTSRGDFSIMTMLTSFSSYNSIYDYKTYTLILLQDLTIFGKSSLNFKFKGDMQKSVTSTYDTNTYAFKIIGIFPAIVEEFILTSYLQFDYVDTVEQKDERGMEKKIEANIKIGRSMPWIRKMKVNYMLGFIKNMSKSKDVYDYQKFTTGIDVGYSF